VGKFRGALLGELMADRPELMRLSTDLRTLGTHIIFYHFQFQTKLCLLSKTQKKKSLFFSADKVTNLLSTLISLKIAERSEASHQKSKFEII